MKGSRLQRPHDDFVVPMPFNLMRHVPTLLLIVCLLSPVLAWAQNPNADEPVPNDATSQNSHRPVQIKFKTRPSFRFREFATVNLKTSWHFDFRGFNPSVWNPPGVLTALPETPPTFYLTRARFGLKGTVTSRVEYEVEHDFRETFGSDPEWHHWKDNYVDILVHRFLQVKAGKFRMPYGMEANLEENRLDFAFESRPSDLLAPNRAVGVMAHSKFTKTLQYSLGVFRYDGEGSDIHGQPTGDRTYAGSFSGEPLRSLKPLPKALRHVYLGVAATRGNLISGLNGMHGETFSNFTYFDHMYVQGKRTRIGTELSWIEGPVNIKAEYMHVSEERKQQGIRGENLPDAISRGWYVMGTWALGKVKSKGAPKTPLLTKHGFGVLMLGARYDIVSFYSAGGPGPPSRSPRAPTILPTGERALTFGPTWYLNHFVQIQANAQREGLTDIERKAVFGINTFWTGIIRLQLAM
jgi:phosphate-selective porin